jgi:hypothetical protein
LAGASHLVDIFGSLLAHDVDNVVDGDQADQLIPLIDHWNSEDIVLGYQVRHLLLVLVGAYVDHVGDHHVLKEGHGRYGQQLAQRQDPHQMAMGIGHIDIKNHFGIAGLLQSLDSLLHGGVLAQREDLRRHDTAGGIFGILQQLLDLFRMLILHGGEDFFSDFLGQVADDFDSIIVGHLLQHLGDGLTTDLLQQKRSGIMIKFRKNTGCRFGILNQIKQNLLFVGG